MRCREPATDFLLALCNRQLGCLKVRACCRGWITDCCAHGQRSVWLITACLPCINAILAERCLQELPCNNSVTIGCKPYEHSCVGHQRMGAKGRRAGRKARMSLALGSRTRLGTNAGRRRDHDCFCRSSSMPYLHRQHPAKAHQVVCASAQTPATQGTANLQ